MQVAMARQILEDHPEIFQAGRFSTDTSSAPGGCGSSFDRIGESGGLIWIPGLNRDRGDLPASVHAHLEIEILHGLLKEKPLWVLPVGDAQPNAEEEEMIRWIYRIRGRSEAELGDHRSLKTALRAARQRRPAIARIGNALADFFEGKIDPFKSLGGIHFLGGPNSDPGGTGAASEIDIDSIRRYLAVERASANLPERLLSLWRALRELFRRPYWRPEATEVLPLWNAALGRWTSAMAWNGGHGPAELSRLAALNSMRTVRLLMRNAERQWSSEEPIEEPDSTLASELYSIAKLLPLSAKGFKWRRTCLQWSEQLIERILATKETGISGLLSMRGYVKLRQARLFSALKDFERCLELAEGTPKEMTVARADHAWALLCCGRAGKARKILESCVAELQTYPVSGFLDRAARQLIWAQLLTGRPFAAAAMRRQLAKWREEMHKPK